LAVIDTRQIEPAFTETIAGRIFMKSGMDVVPQENI
jgi:hypothetical protein